MREVGFRWWTAYELDERGFDVCLAEVIEAARGWEHVFLSIDIDALDPAFAPGTGTPEPGGLSTAQAFTLLEELSVLPFVGMDCVEVAPVYDHQELTSLAAAQMVWTWLAGRVRARST